MSLTPGTRLGPYVLQSLLGAGGMGEVYRAQDSRLGRTVAIKVLPQELASPERIERFEQEARAASALNHPNILTIHDVGREGDSVYFAMEWVEGQTLRELLLAGPIPVRRTVRLAQQIAEGLARAHAAGIVHRDLKPENVMVTADGLVKIVDFGLAKLAWPAARGVDRQAETVIALGATETGIVMGTAGYMSPEQASGRPVDYRSDQFSLGLVLYELLTRTRPFARATMAQTLAATIEDDAAPVESLNPDVPPHLSAIVTRCLAKEPADRYDSTRDLARDLESISASSSRPAVGAPRRPRRIPVLVGVTVGFLLVAAALSVWAWRRTSAVPASSEPERPLLAVRPFRSLSDDPQQAYFAAGVTEEIRGRLSQISSLRLLSRNGLDSYKDDLGRAVRELRIGHLMDGTVRVDGDRVRVSVELVDASEQQTLWSNNYDRALADVLTVQSDVAEQIARAIKANLSASERERIESRPTASFEAYSLYLQAQDAPVHDRARTLAAVALLRQALALDPKFAAAQSRIAFRYAIMGYYDDASYVDKAIAEAQAALRIDPLLPYGYFALGTAYGMKGLHAQARQGFLRALELDPNNVPAMANFSVQEIAHGRLDEATYTRAARRNGASGRPRG